MFMSLRQSSRRRSGSRQIHRGRKKERQVRSNVKSILIGFFSISKALSTRNSYPLVKPSMASFTVKIWGAWGRAFGANVQTSWRKTFGFSNMTMRPLTHHSLFDNSLLPKTLQWFPTPLFVWLRPYDFFIFLKMKLRLKGRRSDTAEEIHAETQEVIDTLTFENFQGFMKSWERHWDRCIHAQGDHFEGDGGNWELR